MVELKGPAGNLQGNLSSPDQHEPEATPCDQSSAGFHAARMNKGQEKGTA
jgi:hypothetical protein